MSRWIDYQLIIYDLFSKITKIMGLCPACKRIICLICINNSYFPPFLTQPVFHFSELDFKAEFCQIFSALCVFPIKAQ